MATTTADGKHGFLPKALIVRNVNEKNDWVDNVFSKISLEFREKHIEVTTDDNKIETVLMTIVFLNAAFIKNCQDLLRLILRNVDSRDMMVILFVYENDDDSKLVTDVFKKYDGDYPTDFYFNTHDPKTLTQLVVKIFNKTHTMFCKMPNSNMNKNVMLGGTLESFIDLLVTHLNPLHLDFTKIQQKLISEVVAMSFKIQQERESDSTDDQPLLALFKYQPSHEHGCTSQMMASILQILYTHHNFINRMDFNIRSIYIPVPSIIDNDEPPSFWSIFNSALKTRYPERGSLRSYIPPTLVVIEDLQKFVREGEDPEVLLFYLLEQLGEESLVITSIPNSRKLDTKCLGPVGETSQCMHCPEYTIGGPVCYTMYSWQLEKLNFVTDDDDSEEARKKMKTY